jgi:membrane associated rhomboid family serine protease
MPRFNLSLPPLTRALFLVLLALSALNVSLRFRKWTASMDSTPSATTPSNYISAPELAVPYLVLVPMKSVKFPWTFLTAALVENNGISLAISGVVIWFGGRYLERAWGSTEYTKFLLFTTMIPNIFAFLVYALWHGVTSTPAQYVLTHLLIDYANSQQPYTDPGTPSSGGRLPRWSQTTRP